MGSYFNMIFIDQITTKSWQGGRLPIYKQI